MTITCARKTVVNELDLMENITVMECFRVEEFPRDPEDGAMLSPLSVVTTT
jgi:hypothetical protein